MKKIYAILILILISGSYSCDTWLDKPDTTGVFDLDVVYSSKKNAHSALMDCYTRVLKHGLGGGFGVFHGVLSNISGERARGYNWHGTYHIAQAGLTATPTSDLTAGADNFVEGWSQIRACYLVIENIDRVPDMSPAEKARFAAEAKALIAYRYMGMFYRYGGVPKATRSYESGEQIDFARMTLAETLQFINELCDSAMVDLPEAEGKNGMTNDEKGRIHQGFILAIKARTALFAARPLFNTGTPYLSLGGNDNLICFGAENPLRWQDAVTANEAVLTWAANNSAYYFIKSGEADSPNTFDQAVMDYGRATSEPSNPEAIMQYKLDRWDNGVFKYICSTPNTGNSGELYDLDESGLLTNSLEKYYTRSGGEQDWPKVGDATSRAATDWKDRINNAEARLLSDNLIAGIEDHVGNPGNATYQASRQGKPLVNSGTTNSFPNAYSVGHGPRAVKFYYRAGGRSWTELPLFRLAETHLNLAEAYNEVGNSDKALLNLNRVHLRAGLPAITETNQDKLRKIIQRERALELYGEGHRYFDAKHWKIDDIATGGLCGPMREFQFHTQANHENNADRFISYWDAVTYNAFWANYMYLEPFPQNEVNKEYLVQNPGY